MTDNNMNINLTDGAVAPEDSEAEIRTSFIRHSTQLAEQIREKFDGQINYTNLQEILQQRKFVRYPVTISFDSSKIEPGLFAVTESKQIDPDLEDSEYEKLPEKAYEIFLHEQFKGSHDQQIPLILYQLPVVNYGDMATYEQSEAFGSALMGMDQEAYYQLICNLTDSIQR